MAAAVHQHNAEIDACEIPAGYSIFIGLGNDKEGRVTGATWNVFNGSGAIVGSAAFALSRVLLKRVIDTPRNRGPSCEA